ncbi:hypothetical protein ABGB07_45915 [Micromonosporaceae bacterium B7E4]
MRTTLRRIGVGAGILIATLGIGSGVAVAAPAATSTSTTAGAATEVSAAEAVYMGTFPHAQCVALMLEYNRMGYLAGCTMVSNTHSALYIYV